MLVPLLLLVVVLLLLVLQLDLELLLQLLHEQLLGELEGLEHVLHELGLVLVHVLHDGGCLSTICDPRVRGRGPASKRLAAFKSGVKPK